MEEIEKGGRAALSDSEEAVREGELISTVDTLVGPPVGGSWTLCETGESDQSGWSLTSDTSLSTALRWWWLEGPLNASYHLL